MIREDFAGAGGWSEAIRQLGMPAPEVAVELDPFACAAARSAGHSRLQADVRSVPPWTPLDGYLASPPCQPLSEAAGDAQAALSGLRNAAEWVAHGVHPDRAAQLHDERAVLSLWPLYVIGQRRPSWGALEQVRTVQPLWDTYAEHLRGWGYSVATGILKAEQYGVPQTRSRSILMFSRLTEIRLPRPTHERPVTMRAALDLDEQWLLRSNYGNNGDPRARGLRSLDHPAPTITGKATRMWWVTPGGDKVRNLSFAEAAALQGFGPEYDWPGDANHRDTIIGNAIPVPLARAILGEIVPLDY